MRLLAAVVWVCGLLIIAVCSGCVSVNLFGGRTQQQVYIFADGNLSEAGLQAETSIEDAIKDLLDQPVVVPPINLPGENPPVEPPPEVTPPSPGNPIDPEVPEPFPPEGDDTFLWKPKSETTGKLVVLTPASWVVSEVWLVRSENNVIEKTRTPGNRNNGNRQHWRFSKPGSGYPNGTHVRVTTSKGVEWVGPIPNTSARYEEK